MSSISQSGSLRPGSLTDVVGRLERLPMTNYQRKLFAVVATGWLADQVNVALLGFLLVTLKDYFHLSLLLAGVLGSMTYVGQLIGNILAGWAADRWGRRRVFQLTMVVWGLGAFLSAGSWGIISLLVFRCIVGIGVGGEAPVAQAILSEFIPANRRGKFISLMEGFWSVGYVISGAVSFALVPVLPANGFRVVFAVTGVLAVVIFLARRWLPESPRWYAEQGHHERADTELKLIEDEISRRIPGELPAPRLTGIVEPVVGNPIAILWRKKYLKWTIMAAGLWFFALLGYFGLTTWLTTLLHTEGYSVAHSLGFTTLISLGGIPGFVAASYLIEWIGRKATLAVFLIGSAGMAYLYGHPVPSLLFAEGFVMQFFFFGMWCVLYAYTPELYPTNARASGAGWASAFGRVGAVIGPIVVGAVLTSVGISGVFTIGAASFVIAVILVVVLGPETKGLVLEEISETGDRRGTVAVGASAGTTG